MSSSVVICRWKWLNHPQKIVIRIQWYNICWSAWSRAWHIPRAYHLASLWPNGTTFTWELSRNADSQAPSQTYWSTESAFFKCPGDLYAHRVRSTNGSTHPSVGLILHFVKWPPRAVSVWTLPIPIQRKEKWSETHSLEWLALKLGGTLVTASLYNSYKQKRIGTGTIIIITTLAGPTPVLSFLALPELGFILRSLCLWVWPLDLRPQQQNRHCTVSLRV